MRILNFRVEERRQLTLAAAEFRSATDRGSVPNAWQQLGSDPVERERSINRMFDAKSGTVEFDTMWDFEYSYQDSGGLAETAYSSMGFHIARNMQH